jgi:hypothetical protein
MTYLHRLEEAHRAAPRRNSEQAAADETAEECLVPGQPEATLASTPTAALTAGTDALLPLCVASVLNSGLAGRRYGTSDPR